jgi:hypothetical protein
MLLIYYQLIEWVNLFPWNEIRGGNGQETLDWIVGAVLLALILITFFQVRWAMTIAVFQYGFWLWLQIDGWWLPYIRGASLAWKKVWVKYFGQTTNFLPAYGDHLPPDACHVVLHLLIVVALVFTILAIFNICAQRGRSNEKLKSN